MAFSHEAANRPWSRQRSLRTPRDFGVPWKEGGCLLRDTQRASNRVNRGGSWNNNLGLRLRSTTPTARTTLSHPPQPVPAEKVQGEYDCPAATGRRGNTQGRRRVFFCSGPGGLRKGEDAACRQRVSESGAGRPAPRSSVADLIRRQRPVNPTRTSHTENSGRMRELPSHRSAGFRPRRSRTTDRLGPA
jgi:hypothetical protein